MIGSVPDSEDGDSQFGVAHLLRLTIAGSRGLGSRSHAFVHPSLEGAGPPSRWARPWSRGSSARDYVCFEL